MYIIFLCSQREDYWTLSDYFNFLLERKIIHAKLEIRNRSPQATDLYIKEENANGEGKRLVKRKRLAPLTTATTRLYLRNAGNVYLVAISPVDTGEKYLINSQDKLILDVEDGDIFKIEVDREVDSSLIYFYLIFYV